MKLLIFIALSVCSVSAVTYASAVPQECSKEYFLNLRDRYFTALNFQNPEIARQAPEFELQLIRDQQDLKQSMASPNVLGDSICRINAGMMLTYTGMFIRNTNDAVLSGIISPKSLSPEQKFGRSLSVKKLVLAREKYALRLLEEALEKYIPGDSLVTAFAESARILIELESTGMVSDPLWSRLIKDAYKNHHIYFAIVVALRGRGLSSKRSLDLLKLNEFVYGEAKRGNLLKNSKRWDFELYDQQEFYTKYAPHAFQGFFLSAGDVFVERGEKLLFYREKDKAQGLGFLKQGLESYSALGSPMLQASTQSWPGRNALSERTERVNRLVQNPNPGNKLQGFWGTVNGQAPYRCLNCHSPNSSYPGMKLEGGVKLGEKFKYLFGTQTFISKLGPNFNFR